MDGTQRTIGDELGALRAPVAWALLGAAALLLLVPVLGLVVPGTEPMVDTLPQRALGATVAFTNFPLLALPVLAVVVARGSADLPRVGLVAALEYGAVLLFGLVTVALVLGQGGVFDLGGGAGFAVPTFLFTQLVKLGVAAVALVVTLRLARR
jgi:hypothetical protein